MNYCKKCGQEIQTDLFMCSRCKRPIELDPNDKISYREKGEYSYRNKGKGLLILGLIFTFFSLVLYSIYYYYFLLPLTEFGIPIIFGGGDIFFLILIGSSLLVIIWGILLYFRKE
jgi:hypothetical protein